MYHPDYCFRLATNNVQQSRRTPTAALAYSAALEKLEAKWFKRRLDQRDALLKVFRESEARSFKRSEEEHARMFNQLEDQVKSFHDQRTALLKNFDAKQQQHERKVEELVQQNCYLLVGSPLLRLSTGFLIPQ